MYGPNKILTVQLNLKYGMVTEISALPNAMSRRNVRTRIVPRSLVYLTDPSTDDPVPPILYTRLITDLQFDNIQHDIPWIDPYVNSDNLNHSQTQRLNEHFNNDRHERSPFQALAVTGVIQEYMDNVKDHEFLNMTGIFLSTVRNENFYPILLRTRINR